MLLGVFAAGCELSSPSTYANTKEMVERLEAAGMEFGMVIEHKIDEWGSEYLILSIEPSRRFLEITIYSDAKIQNIMQEGWPDFMEDLKERERVRPTILEGKLWGVVAETMEDAKAIQAVLGGKIIFEGDK